MWPFAEVWCISLTVCRIGFLYLQTLEKWYIQSSGIGSKNILNPKHFLSSIISKIDIEGSVFTISMLKAWSIFISQLTMIKENPFCQRECISSGTLIRLVFSVAWPVSYYHSIFLSLTSNITVQQGTVHTELQRMWKRTFVSEVWCVPVVHAKEPSLKGHRFGSVWISPIFQYFIFLYFSLH